MADEVAICRWMNGWTADDLNRCPADWIPAIIDQANKEANANKHSGRRRG